MTLSHWLRILVFQTLPGIWAARSLEYDIAVEANSRDAALDLILRIVFAHIDFDHRHGRQPLSTFPEAPQRFWRAFDEAAPIRVVKCDRDGRRGADGCAILIAQAERRPGIEARVLPLAPLFLPLDGPPSRPSRGRLPLN